MNSALNRPSGFTELALSGQIDLHCHSTASDGILSPAALVSRAKCQGVSLLALTDHDTVRGVDEASRAAKCHDLTLIPGIEFTAGWGKRSVHIVGLNFDHESTEIRSAVELRDILRAERAEKIAEKLEKCGFHGALAGAAALAEGAVIGRPHFARWLVEAGHVDSTARAFKRYLGAGKAGDVSVEWPQLDETIRSIRAAGGAAILAHPLKYGLTRTRLLGLLLDFAGAGGDAVEVVCGQQNPVQTREILTLLEQVSAKGWKLHASLGSDFHQPDQPWRELGGVRLPPGVEPVWNLWQTDAHRKSG
ncbi:PHP domain-containing protein [Microbulbifer aggregans]|uniref:PHP domain-containing protein n=1 Tax=Microbulbifer aggregans TaxID=1769779 RepID=UPI001CFE9353|nr:PHP domain-containing protein [Microbulbifer aggregans]